MKNCLCVIAYCTVLLIISYLVEISAFIKGSIEFSSTQSLRYLFNADKTQQSKHEVIYIKVDKTYK